MCFVICFLFLFLPPHFKHNTDGHIPHIKNKSSAFCARVLVMNCWDWSSKHPGSDTHKPILSPVTGTKSISIPYLQVVTLPVIGKESPSSYVDLTLMKYWVREDKGLKTVDVAVPGTSTCSGGVVWVLCEKGWESWACSAWRREGSEETLLRPFDT